MKCPHCSVEFHDQPIHVWLGKDSDGNWILKKLICANPKCKKEIYYLLNTALPKTAHPSPTVMPLHQVPSVHDERLVRPKSSTRSPLPPEVSQEFAEDYLEACLVLQDSPKASAALSRRCLQHILREKGGFKARTLDAEISLALKSGTFPTHIADCVDCVRNVGNFAAHPIKSQQSGEILQVEPGEAEWNLDVIEMLFDFYFVQPDRTRLKREALNQKLQEAGKLSMK